MTQLSTLNKYFWRYRWHFFLGILFVILTNYFRILSPQLTGYVVNTVVNSIDTVSPGKYNTTIVADYDILVREVIRAFNDYSFRKKIFVSGIILLIIAIISGFFMFLMRQTIIVMSRHIEFDQKNEIYAHYQELDLGFYKSHSTGDLMNRISEDVSRVRMYTGPAIMYFINLAAVIGFSVYFMFKSDVKLSIVALSPLPFLAFAIYFVNTIINRKSEKIQTLLSSLTTNAQESYSGIRVIKSFVQEKAMLGFFNSNSDLYKGNALSLAKTEAVYFPSIGLLIGLSTIITVMVGGIDVTNKVPGASVGKIAEFVMYIQMLTFPVSAIGWTASMTQRAVASQKRINEFLHTSPAIKNPSSFMPVATGGNLKFNNVTFTYPNTGITAIKKITFSVSKGETVAIIGSTGSGKSTLAHLILRMFDPEEGEIKLGSTALNDANLYHLRSQISYVPQDVFLFSDSILNNIMFGTANATPEMAKNAARLACIHEEIERFPEAYNTLVGERGVTLSGGQKQRIAIARSLIKNSEIVIFDDCLSAVDGNTEKQIINNLEIFLKEKMAIIITHRVFSLFEFDKIIFLENGMIAEEGTHQELLNNKGLYSEMFFRQKSKFEEESGN